jgi:hypothetical protein
MAETNTTWNKTLEELKKQKEMDYSLIIGKKLKGIQFETNFLKIVFEDGTVMCENDTIITDNCKTMLNKKDVLNNTYSTHFMLKVMDNSDYKKIIVSSKEKSKIFYLIDVNTLTKEDVLAKINEVKGHVNLVLIPKTIEDKNTIEKYFGIKMEDKTVEKLKELLEKNVFELPATVMLSEISN